MPKNKSPKYYLVLSKSRNYTYGAFPHTTEGKKNAEDFIRQNSKKFREELYIKAK
jgi:hypothetical protein